MRHPNDCAVLVHGCDLKADLNGQTWEQIVWGLDSNGKPTLNGRATMGIYIALYKEAGRIIFSSGASERDGVKEGSYTYNWALDHVDQLSELFGVESKNLRSFLESDSELDLRSQNTVDECQHNITQCMADGFKEIILVSSPWHIHRCLEEALVVAEQLRSKGLDVPPIFATASHGSAEDVVIVEPAHRGDQFKHSLAALVRRMFPILRGSPAEITEFQTSLGRFLDGFGLR